MNELDRLSLLLSDLPVYLANGVLVILYWLAAHTPALASLVSALVMSWLPDAEIQQRAGFRPRGRRVPRTDLGGKRRVAEYAHQPLLGQTQRPGTDERLQRLYARRPGQRGRRAGSRP